MGSIIRKSQIMCLWKTMVLITMMLVLVSGLAWADRHTPTLPMPTRSNDGMYAQNWFYNSQLDLRADMASTAKDGKRLVIFWESRHCFNCKPMYEINLRIPRIIEKITRNFNVVKLDVFGDRQVTGLDGAVMSEMKLAQKYKITFTPTLQFLAESLDMAAGENGMESEVFRSEGYFKPFHFLFLFHYVQTKGYASEPNFQRWLGAIGRGMQQSNIEYDLWADALPANLPDRY